MSGRLTDDHDRRGSSYSSSRRRSRTRSRSRSPTSSSKEKVLKGSTKIDESNFCSSREKKYNHDRLKTNSSDTSQAPPPPPIITKVSFGMSKTNTTQQSKPVLGIQMKLPVAPKPEPKSKITVASAFANDSEEDEVEEMPAECRMRMRNIGRDTPTSSGPNSFGKTKHGFCNSRKIFERKLKHHWEEDDS